MNTWFTTDCCCYWWSDTPFPSVNGFIQIICQNAGFKAEELNVALHSPGYVSRSNEKAIEEYYPGYAELWTKLGKERG